MDWLTAAEALAILGTKPQSLYANVSRGRVRARKDADDPRRSRYAKEDVMRLAGQKAGPRRAAAIAADTTRWGEAILPSAISTIADGRLYYRGRDAVALSERTSFADVATVLWDGDQSTTCLLEPSTHARNSGMAAAFALLAERAANDLPASGRSSAVLRSEAARLHAELAAALGGGGEGEMHEALATRWHCPHASDILRRALILLAEHELNASAFAVRVTASTGASLAASLLSGLATLSGPRHGGAASAALELCDLAAKRGGQTAIRRWLQQGRPLPGFGHPLYLDGDIRAQALLADMDLPEPLRDLERAALEMTGERPNIDFVLAAAIRLFALPEAAPLIIFAIARSAGWLAHAIEQVEAATLIRPRARYTGVPVAPHPTGKV